MYLVGAGMFVNVYVCKRALGFIITELRHVTVS